ncbi:hypothetical protein [Mycolicibacterium sp. GESEQ-9]|uniref:hypothetical protein n=1 Tax=Mycolicibacterium sp. GESEQ-9 TaxID=2812656 RepID=UPI001B33503A|nr:hypothetical protein [Mycolicibacterium sp. GESEQ-9]
MKITARLSETGREVKAADNADWAEVHCHPARKRPALYCPDSPNGCRTELVACERPNKTRGTITRYFAFKPRGDKCGHAAVKTGVEVPDPAAKPPSKPVEAAGSGESDEHLWLKNLVAQIAEAANYVATHEQELPGGVRADVYIEGAQQAGRVEVQRVATDIPARTERHPDVVWLLREAYSTSSGNKTALWGNPCVQLRIRAPRIVNGKRSWVAAEPWAGSQWADAQVSASSTVLRLSHKDGGEPFFDTQPIDLALFLRQVWSGKRRWYPKGRAHKSFAGWALVGDVEALESWQQQRREQMRAAAARSRPSTPVPARPPAKPVPAPVQAREPAARPAARAAPAPQVASVARTRPAESVRQQPPRRGRLWRYLRAFFEL